MDNAIVSLDTAALKVVLGTPTATAPKWLCAKYPDILPVDIHASMPRSFASQQHYDFLKGLSVDFCAEADIAITALPG